MAKQPPKKYEPGELERTRGRLGPLSREESRRLAEMFGGDVGVERDDPALEGRYRRIREESYRGKALVKRGAPFTGSGSSDGGTGRYRRNSSIPNLSDKRTHLNRFRLWHYASRPEFGIMRRSSAWLVLWPFARPRELLDPRFVLNSGEIFYRHIETAVLAVRGLLRRVEKNRIHQLRSPFYRDIAECIKDWEIEAMHKELTRIQLHPRSVQPADFAQVLFYLFRPIMKFQRIDHVFIERTVRHLYDLSILELPKRNLEADRMQKYFLAVQGELHYIFEVMPVRCYPLLLLLFSPAPQPYKPFLEDKRELLLDFLKLKEDEICNPPRIQSGELYEDSRSEETEEEVPEGMEVQEETAEQEEPEAVREEAVTGFRQSLLMIERLFPGSGWIRLNEQPDLFPYFDPILKLPQGSGLIHPGDPLQHTVILTAIMGDLLYGFREADMGTGIDETGMPQELKPQFETIASMWHQFLDVLIEKHYLETLRDYCRNVERSFDFVLSEYGQRIEADLLFLRKKYLFPKLQLSIPKYLQPRQLPPVAGFDITVSRLKKLLAQLAENDGNQALRNPQEPYHFPVPNTLSRRLDSLLSIEEREKSILNLTRYTLAVAIVLEHVLQQEQRSPSPLYRHVEQREDLPIYSVTSLDTGKLLRRFEERRRKGTLDPLGQTGEYDELTGLAGSGLVEQELEALLSLLPENGPVILRIRTEPHHMMDTAKKIEENISLFQDQLFRLHGGDFLVLLTRHSPASALEKARTIGKVLERKAEKGPVISVIAPEPPAPGVDLQEKARGLLRETENAVPGGDLPPGLHIFLWDREKRMPVEQAARG